MANEYDELLGLYPNAKKFLSALQSQNFEPSDSQIVSTIMHPIEGAKRLSDKFTNAVNTVAGYPDLESANPLYAASPNEQVKSALDLAGTAGTGSMPFVEAGPATLGIFAGKLAKNAPTEKFFEADNLARDLGLYDASVGSSQWMQKNKDIWNQTGIHYGYDMKPRFEIPDTAFRLSTPEDYRNIVDQANANMQALTDESKLIRQAKKEPTPQTDLFEKELAKSRNQRLKDIKTELETTKQELSKPYGVEWGLEGNGLKGVNTNISMPHPELYKAYPQIGEDVVLRYEPRIGGGGKYFNNQIDIYGNPENESSRSTGIHELQHAIQELEGWNRGGNPEAAPYIRYQLARDNFQSMSPKIKENANLVDELMRQKSPLSKVAYIHDLENIRQPRDLFNTDSWYKNSDTVRSLIGSPPRYGSKLPYAQKAGEVLARIEKTSLPYEAFQLYNSGLPREEVRRQLKNIDAKINRRWDDWRTASQARQEVVKSDPIQNKFSDQEKFDMYKRLAGEAEARAVQTRLNLTPEERAATFPLEDYDVNNPMVHYLTEFTLDNKYAQGGSVNTDSTDSAVEDYKQLLDAYPNAKKFLSALGANVENIVPSANDIKDPNKMMDVALNFGPSNLASGLAGVIKPKGGNWTGIPEAIESLELKHRSGLDPKYLADRLRSTHSPEEILNQQDLKQILQNLDDRSAINDWLQSKAAKYIQNEMATPEDPIRALAEKGILHFQPDDIASNYFRDQAKYSRNLAGYPAEPMATSDLAKSWEDMADFGLMTTPASFLKYKNETEKYPWLNKVPDKENIYSPNLHEHLNFNHLRDELYNSIRHDSDLPEALRLDPSKLNKVSVPQAVERVAKINEWRAAQKAEANAALARNPATHLHKDYPEQGLSWVELKQPNEVSDTSALANALKYEGDVMGHCVGGYCPDVAAGRSRIFSLRDTKGEPHVTIETRPGLKDPFDEYFIKENLTPEETQLFKAAFNLPNVISIHSQLKAANLYDKLLDRYNNLPEPLPQIKQIKGKGNKAPAEKYLSAVQDFVRSGKWSDVGDIRNTGFNSFDELMKGYADGGSVEVDSDHIQSIIDELHQGEYGLRPDQTEKGRGYLNELKRPDGNVMTEYSIGMPINGVEMDVPTLVPDLTIDEIKSILSMPEGGKIPKSIQIKAQEHAIKRIKEDKPVFATPEESEFGER